MLPMPLMFTLYYLCTYVCTYFIYVGDRVGWPQFVCGDSHENRTRGAQSQGNDILSPDHLLIEIIFLLVVGLRVSCEPGQEVKKGGGRSGRL